MTRRTAPEAACPTPCTAAACCCAPFTAPKGTKAGTFVEPTLLERDLVSEKSALAKIFKTAGYRTIRQGKRDINGMSGTEKLIKWQGNKYMLIWERDGGDPRIMMKFGADRAEGTGRSEAEILAIWDTVLPTLKSVK